MTLYRDETDELTTERRNFVNKCRVQQRLRSDSDLTVPKNPEAFPPHPLITPTVWGPSVAFAEKVTFETV